MRRLLAAVGVVSVGLLVAFGEAAAAAGPKPEPPPAGALRSLRPDPAPATSPTHTVTSGSTSSPRSSSPPAQPATPSTGATSSPTVPAAQPTVSSPAQPASSSSSGTTVRTQPPAASQAAKTRHHVTRKATRKRSHHASTRLPALLSVPAFVRNSLHLPGGAVVKPASSSSTLWFVGALALVVLALGETTFLTYVRSRISAPAPRQRKVYWDAGGPIRRVPLER